MLARKEEARRKLYPLMRACMWQAWTRRCKDVVPAREPLPRGAVRRLCGVEALSPLSLRDEYILKRAKALFVAAFPKRVHSTRSVSGWLRAPYVSDEESNDDLGGFPEHRDSPMPSPLRAGAKHASTPKSRSKGKKSRDG